MDKITKTTEQYNIYRNWKYLMYSFVIDKSSKKRKLDDIYKIWTTQVFL